MKLMLISVSGPDIAAILKTLREEVLPEVEAHAEMDTPNMLQTDTTGGPQFEVDTFNRADGRLPMMADYLREDFFEAFNNQQKDRTQ